MAHLLDANPFDKELAGDEPPSDFGETVPAEEDSAASGHPGSGASSPSAFHASPPSSHEKSPSGSGVDLLASISGPGSSSSSLTDVIGSDADPIGSLSGTSSLLSGIGSITSLSPIAFVPPEDGPYKQFQKKHEATLLEKRKKASEKEKEAFAQSKADLDKFYADRLKTTNATKDQNRKDEQAKKTAKASDNEWKRVTEQLDFKDTSAKKDVSRFREVLVSLSK
eukprot:TRINITY_DN4116_c0_g1_i2.p1 TRINITY_DN4116_c0_g1~~TRINITY_DN4116_c0_g1_i2.p1  ORF type:complete len:233 (+),score=59.94 TRINITY_DN4116_c0_g1_i2:30-701(+)